jgi:hypothetical protein
VKNQIIIIIISAFLISCSTKQTVIFTQDYTTHHTDWKLSNDTIIKFFTLKRNNGPIKFEIPMKVSWTIATDSNKCVHVGFVKLERIGKNKKYKITDASVNTHLSNSELSNKCYYSMYINLNISRKTLFSSSGYGGTVCKIDGLGEFTLSSTDTPEKQIN